MAAEFSLGDAILNIGASTKSLNKSLGDAESASKKSFGNILAMGQKIGVGLTAAGAGIDDSGSGLRKALIAF